jgi:PAS domain S-box-containing protein
VQIVFANRASEQLLGYPPGDLVGRPVLDLVPERLRRSHQAYHDQYLENPTPRPMGMGRELVGRRKDGTEIPVEIGLTPITTASGTWVMCTIRDLREQRQVEAERARLQREVEVERARLQTIVDSALNAIYYVDAETDHLRANPAVAHLFGHRIVPEQGREQFAQQEFYPNGKPVPLDDLPSSRALRGEQPMPTELVVKRPDGTSTPIVMNAGPVVVEPGVIVGAVVVAQDISALKEVERLREEWTSVVAHDLRQPITVITGYASLLEESTARSSARVQTQVGHILNSARLLSRMIRDLLDSSRIETRRLTLERRDVNLATFVPGVVERSAAVTRNHTVTVTVRNAMPRMSADPGRIEQVLTNLLSNTAKYGNPRSDIEVSLEVEDDAVKVGVTNRGPGIRLEEIPTLFNRFIRTRSAQQRTREGLGLGLYIAKGLVEAHGGRIWVESTPGETTTFWFTLPLEQRS